jgi:hypothetical protein
MDCKTARLLLEFHRPRATELDDAEVAALEDHLAGCPDCETAGQAEHRVDVAIGKAMRDVRVPDHLRGSLLAHLAADSPLRKRRRLSRLAIAAAILLLPLAGFGWWLNHRPAALTAAVLDEYWIEVKNDHVSPPDAEAVGARFRHMGIEATVPRNFSYKYLAAYGIGDFQGQRVPQMVFVRDGTAGGRAAHAQVLILSPRQFDLEQFSGEWRSEEGYPYRVDAIRPAGSPQVYVIFHTGDDFDWLQEHGEV